MDRIFQIESLDVFKNVSQEILTNLYYSGLTYPPLQLEADIIAAAKQELISIISNCNFNSKDILAVFNNRQWDQDKVKWFHGFMETNKSEVFYSAFNHYNSTYCETVVNFDWFVKFVLGNSELKTLKYPLLQLMMSTLNINGKQTKIIYDTNKDMLLKMIIALEKIK